MKGQANPQSYIALLVLVIAVILIVYILMLPPEDRADLLDEPIEGGDGGGGGTATRTVTAILEREPGTILHTAQDEITYDFPAMRLFTSTNAEEIADYDSIFLEKSLFDEQKREIHFGLEDVQNMDNLRLSFNVQRHGGILVVDLNGVTIISREVTSSFVEKLPADLLQESNTLTFSIATGPGIRFWDTNEYLLTDIMVTADITDKSGQQQKQFFFISENEMDLAQSFELSFAVDCATNDLEPLQIYLNKNQFYYSVPDCGSVVHIPPIEAADLQQGQNDILYHTDKGSYQLYRIEGVLDLKEATFPTYYFPLDQATINDISAGDADVNLTVLFANFEEAHQGFVYINGIRLEFPRFQRIMNREISDYVIEGNNVIQLRPDETIDLPELKVLLTQ